MHQAAQPELSLNSRMSAFFGVHWEAYWASNYTVGIAHPLIPLPQILVCLVGARLKLGHLKTFQVTDLTSRQANIVPSTASAFIIANKIWNPLNWQIEIDIFFHGPKSLVRQDEFNLLLKSFWNSWVWYARSTSINFLAYLTISFTATNRSLRAFAKRFNWPPTMRNNRASRVNKRCIPGLCTLTATSSPECRWAAILETSGKI